jgi:hypothetical protein
MWRLWGQIGLVCAVAVVVTTSTLHAAEKPARATNKPIAGFDGAITAKAVRPHVEFLASRELRGRSGNDARKAAKYIVARFQKWGLKPLFEKDGYYQDIPTPAKERKENLDRPVLGRNVGAFLLGSDPKLRDEVLIISAHYDHLGVRGGRIYAGADDNASGVSMMLEVARRLSELKRPPKRSIAFVGFDLEERLLWGSRWFAAHPPWPIERVKLFITADMIGRSLGNLNLPTVFVMGSEHAPALKTALDKIGQPKGLEVARLGVDLIGTRSDYGPFRDRKVPFLFFSTGQHPDYHTPSDVPERIDFEKVARVSSLVLRLTKHIADGSSVPRWTDDPAPDIDEAKSVHRIATLLLEADGDDRLSDVQRLIVSHTRTKAGQIVARKRMTAEERTWLTRMAQVLLLSVF